MTDLIHDSDPHHRRKKDVVVNLKSNLTEMTTLISHEIEIPITEGSSIKGDLFIPDQYHSLVIFSHGSGSSRFSPRNRYVAEYLTKHHFAALLMDLLTPPEDQEYANRFDIDLLTDRLVVTTNYISKQPELASCSIGYFGASTGAASALQAAARLGEKIGAVVSRGGRPDLAANALAQVKAPVLLIVGSLDKEVILLNKKALTLLNHHKKLVIVEGASHLFEERGKLDEVASLATDWFTQYLQRKEY